MELKSSSTQTLQSEKHIEIAMKIRIKPPRKKEQENNAYSSSSSTEIHCSECSMSFSSTKALFGHLRIHRKNNNEAEKTMPFSYLRKAQNAEDVIAACILMDIRRSKLETDIDDAKLSKLRLVCSKIERQRMKMKKMASNQSGKYHSITCETVAPSMLALARQSVGQWITSNNNEKANVGTVRSVEVEIHQCDKCDKVFNSGQALGGHKRAHYTGPPLCRPTSNIRSQQAAMAAASEVVVCDFDLNEPPDEMLL